MIKGCFSHVQAVHLKARESVFLFFWLKKLKQINSATVLRGQSSYGIPLLHQLSGIIMIDHQHNPEQYAVY
ncbi:unnamed protein product [Cuscuta campestris]|uniref:Uncharacterized protein n=1 Tax=Cuscuta campestris TaxID=132261 RepID=A0A484N1U2_9ASTE|nr:unnamed protein product [Cuscuta campestris]